MLHLSPRYVIPWWLMYRALGSPIMALDCTLFLSCKCYYDYTDILVGQMLYTITVLPDIVTWSWGLLCTLYKIHCVYNPCNVVCYTHWPILVPGSLVNNLDRLCSVVMTAGGEHRLRWPIRATRLAHVVSQVRNIIIMFIRCFTFGSRPIIVLYKSDQCPRIIHGITNVRRQIMNTCM